MCLRPHLDQPDLWPEPPYSRLSGPAPTRPPTWVGERWRLPVGRSTQNRPDGATPRLSVHLLPPAPRWTSIALAANLVVVVLAAIVAIVLLVVALGHGW